ncbi:MAG: F0F1 ATP synthase subunit delta [Chloroflexi bacterium]|nr:F0F1 ATP synthase subunit delta [Chloroflexota bacterium]
MLIGGAAKRYAQAVFELARESTSFDVWSRDLHTLGDLVRDEAGRQFFSSPKADAAQKWRVAENYLASRVQPQALNLARLLIERGRFVVVDRVAVVFDELVREQRGVAIADVTTAVPLGPAEAEAVSRRLGAVVGKRIELTTHVDPSIIGGIIAHVGDYRIDGSVTGQLARLRARLVEGR